MSKYKRKRLFVIESDTDDCGRDDQLLVNKKCCRIPASDTEDSSGDEYLHQSHPLIRRSPRGLEDEDGGSGPHLLYIESEPDSPRYSFVQEETERTRRQERPINYCLLKDLSSPTSKYVTNFHKNKQELIRRLYKYYNQTVFENQLPAYMDISWNKRLTKTSGRTGILDNNGDRNAIIQLSDKICDSAERLRDILIHEMCHAACWIIDGRSDDPHGLLWHYYCAKASLAHPELPPFTQYHTYEYHYPVVYQCSGCEFRIGRWSESLNTEKFVCGYCSNKMILVIRT